jgi:NarL family two-component system sensor histidine kinase LiaS
VVIDFKSELEGFSIDKKIEFHLYRLIKEIINNTIKHTKASTIELEIIANKMLLTITISHNGEGITTKEIKKLAENSTGLGLKSIFSRGQLINSEIQYLVPENQNAKVTIKTPLL